MDENGTNELNEKEKNEVLMKYIAKRYKQIKKEIKKGYRPTIDTYTIDEGVEFVQFVDRIVDALPDEYELIIKNDYLENRKPKWWNTYFRKSTYY
ncbi:MAG: MG284/MPN403 family protein, partial [Traorella sp.]